MIEDVTPYHAGNGTPPDHGNRIDNPGAGSITPTPMTTITEPTTEREKAVGKFADLIR